MTERQLQDAIVTYARLSGWLVYHTYDSRRSEPGYPDLHMVRGGRSVFAELKAEKGVLSPEQHAWLERLLDAGHEAYVWRPVSWTSGEVEAILGRKASAAA